MRYLLCLLMFISPCVATAGYPTYFYPSYSPIVYPTYEIHNHYNRITVFQDTPTYAIGQGAPYVAPAHSSETPCDAKLKALEATFNAKIAALEEKAKASAVPAPQPPVNPPTTAPTPPQPPPMGHVSDTVPRAAERILGGKCAVCHDGKVSEAKGNGVMLTRGGQPVADFSAELIGKCLQYVSKGSCPKEVKLTQQEYNWFVQELVNLSKQ